MAAFLLLAITASCGQTALVIGVNDYHPRSRFTDLKHAEAEAELIAARIGPVILLRGEHATKRAILKTLLAKPINFVCFCGHGLHQVNDGRTTEFIAVSDSRADAPESLLSIAELLTALQGRRAEVILRCCRDQDGSGVARQPQYDDFDAALRWDCQFGQTLKDRINAGRVIAIGSRGASARERNRSGR